MAVNGHRRVVITGIGALTPLGNDAETSWQRLLAGESGAGPITQFDATDYHVHFACEVKDFDPSNWIERKQARRMDRFAQLILAAARQAEADSGVDVKADGDRIGASIATGIGGLKSFQDCYDTLKERGPDRVNPFAIPCIIPNMGAGWVSMQLGTRGPLASQCTACAASNMAIGDGTDQIRLGRADIMLCGGTEAAINEVGIAGSRAMRNAFGDAGIAPGEIDYINAHGTSTPLGDASETRVIKMALGEENAAKTPVSSTKGATGHCLGAAGAIEAIFSTLAIRDGKLPPTINQEVADPECDLDYIPNESRDADVRVTVSNSFGFGGHNASIVLKRFED